MRILLLPAAILLAAPVMAAYPEAEGRSPAIRANPDKPPVEIVYDDALDCAVFDGFAANLLEGDAELADQQAYYDKIGDLWLDALGRSDPDNQDKMISDFKDHATTFAQAYKADIDANGEEEAVGNVIDKYRDSCAALEQGIFGNDDPAPDASASVAR